ncbi:hypothetical protein OEZ85_012172 [Tetradesmus obliquus]|uniref:XPG N-terminal domain-containing protein n=1 Tax=Tetradesmus obliquus TaxID=3088 RepID=A0ABY8TUY1_TETOB|nr:hypothetical protein OEZ85_012172 [Tetradesmus obliquus]
MGVNNLWKALGTAVQTLEGHTPGQHAEIVEAVENKVVAVDLSAWLMQAQSQPALLEHYDSPYARAAKVVFDRTIHWLRYGCLPVFVIEGQTPAAKLEKLRQRCVAQYGPTARSYDVGNRAGGQFDKLGQAMKRLLDAFGVPCVQAAGEGEAMCAALNLCGWAHACHTLDVDVLLFGALTVYRQMHLQTDDPRKSSLVRCCRGDVQRLLGITRGGEAALQCIAQLAGGDYDTTGAEQVGEGMAMDAVRHLLQGCEDDEAVLQKLEAMLEAGPDPELDALTKCTGCKACGHEGGMKSRIAQHSKRSGGCSGCGCESGCVPRQWQQCECNFHRRAGERLLNRVVRRAVQTRGFMASCRTAAATYTSELRKAVAAVQREYSLPVPGSSRNVFTWRARPDVRAIGDIMTKYIKEWDHNQVRLKLLPLLLEWDMRQGPQPSPSSGVQFRPTGIRKVSSKGAEDMSSVPARQQQGWRYVLLVERLQQQRQQTLAADAEQDAEDLAVDLAWIAGTARSRPPKLASSFSSSAAAAAASGSAAAAGADDAEGEPWLSQMPATQGPSFSCSQAAPASQAAGSGGGRSGGSLQFSEHRSVRCSLVEAVWPELVAAYRNPPASARARPAGRKKAAATATAAATPAAAAGAADKQRNLKEYFNTVKDYTAAAKPSSKPGARRPAAESGSIPGLAGIAAGSSAAAAAADSGRPAAAGSLGGRLSHMPAVAAAAAGAAGAAEAGGRSWVSSTTKKQPPGRKSFSEWLDSVIEGDEDDYVAQQQQQQQQQQGRLTAQFAALLDEAGVLSPVPQRQQAGTSASRPKSAKELFAARPVSRQQQQQDVIELLDSPGDAGGLQRQHCLDAGHGSGVVDAVEDDDADVVDLT